MKIKFQKKLSYILVISLGMFFSSCDFELKPSNRMVDRAFDTPKMNSSGTAVYVVASSSLIPPFEDLLYLILNKNNSLTSLKLATGNKNNVKIIQNCIITPTGRAAAFWMEEGSTTINYAFTNAGLNALGPIGTINLGSAGAGVTGISLATNANNQVVAAWNLKADEASSQPASQFMIFNPDGSVLKDQSTLFVANDFASFTSGFVPKPAIDDSGNVLFGQTGGFDPGGGMFIYTTCFKYWNGLLSDVLAKQPNYPLLTCKATKQGLFAIWSNEYPTVNSTLSDTTDLYFGYYSGEDILSSSAPTGNALSTDVVQYWSSENKADTSTSFFITGLELSDTGLSANGYTFQNPSSLSSVSPSPKINGTTSDLAGFSGGTISYAGINNGYFVAALSGSIWGGLGNFANGELSFIKKLSSTIPEDAQVTVDQNGQYLFIWTDPSGRVQTYPASSVGNPLKGALQKFSPTKYQKEL